MTTLTIDPGGPSKREIVSQAFGICGVADLEFGLEADLLVDGLRRLNSLMAELQSEGVALGYHLPDYGVGEAEEGSGILFADQDAVAGLLAMRVGAMIGKTLAPEAVAQIGRSASLMRSRWATIPTMPYARGNFRGMGSGRGRYSPYLSTDGGS